MPAYSTTTFSLSLERCNLMMVYAVKRFSFRWWRLWLTPRVVTSNAPHLRTFRVYAFGLQHSRCIFDYTRISVYSDRPDYRRVSIFGREIFPALRMKVER
jgi:hypothetical protein